MNNDFGCFFNNVPPLALAISLYIINLTTFSMITFVLLWSIPLFFSSLNKAFPFLLKNYCLRFPNTRSCTSKRLFYIYAGCRANDHDGVAKVMA